VIGDGRSILAARDAKYDQIHIGFTDTLSGNAAQGFALTENNLYAGGLRKYSRTRAAGAERLALTCWWATRPCAPPC
jgi:hypothetical protein